jgi:cytochrome c oxidase assembly factor CtaG
VFVAIAVTCLGYGFYLVYRNPRACAEGSYCASPSSNRVAKIGLWTAIVLIIVAAGFPRVPPCFCERRRHSMRHHLFAAAIVVTAILFSLPVQ